MNRSLVIFVALALLVAHSLAIRTDAGGDLAPPYDQAFVAFRVARNLVFEGQWIWAPGQSGIDSYPSTLWVVICAAAERLNVSINVVVRLLGVLATATSLFMATRFHAQRTASLITPMLLAISGATATAAVSGTETALFTALVTASFLAFERRWEWTLGLALLLSGWNGGEGWVLALTLLALRLYARRKSGGRRAEAGSLKPFLVPLVGFAALALLRLRLSGSLGSPWWHDLVDLRPGELQNGLAYVRDFFVSSVSPALILYCIWYMIRRNLSSAGQRALLIFTVWTAVVVLRGGGRTPFSESMVPILPVAFIAGQEGLITALNSTKRPVRGLAWASILVAVLASTLASFRPSDIGPIPLEGWQREWMRATTVPRYGFDDDLGRSGLEEEARSTRFLRDLAIFMRDELDPSRSVLTPWPGSIAYISSLPTIDLLGRATPAPPLRRTSNAPIQARVDVLAALGLAPDYIVPFWREQESCPTIADLAREWHSGLDSRAQEAGRLAALEEALEAYEVITIPLRRPSGENLAHFRDHGIMVRKRSLGLAPKLVASLEEGRLRLELEHRGHYQLGDLSVRAVRSDGTSSYLAPTGNLAEEPVLARSKLLMTETGDRRILLLEVFLGPAELKYERLHINLLNPMSTGDAPASRISEEIVLELP
jgi:hypothetical protein